MKKERYVAMHPIFHGRISKKKKVNLTLFAQEEVGINILGDLFIKKTGILFII